MKRYGISVDVKNVPVLDPEFTPLLKFNNAFLEGAEKPVSIAVERADGQMVAINKYFTYCILNINCHPTLRRDLRHCPESCAVSSFPNNCTLLQVHGHWCR